MLAVKEFDLSRTLVACFYLTCSPGPLQSFLNDQWSLCFFFFFFSPKHKDKLVSTYNLGVSSCEVSTCHQKDLAGTIMYSQLRILSNRLMLKDSVNLKRLLPTLTMTGFSAR